jgi:hypothetical protein
MRPSATAACRAPRNTRVSLDAHSLITLLKGVMRGQLITHPTQCMRRQTNDSLCAKQWGLVAPRNSDGPRVCTQTHPSHVAPRLHVRSVEPQHRTGGCSRQTDAARAQLPPANTPTQQTPSCLVTKHLRLYRQHGSCCCCCKAAGKLCAGRCCASCHQQLPCK